MHQKSAAVIAPMLSWASPQVTSALLHVTLLAFARGPAWWFPLLLEVSIRTSGRATDSFPKTGEGQEAATSWTQGFF